MHPTKDTPFNESTSLYANFIHHSNADTLLGLEEVPLTEARCYVTRLAETRRRIDPDGITVVSLTHTGMSWYQEKRYYVPPLFGELEVIDAESGQKVSCPSPRDILSSRGIGIADKASYNPQRSELNVTTNGNNHPLDAAFAEAVLKEGAGIVEPG